jgi:hypothetical protein
MLASLELDGEASRQRLQFAFGQIGAAMEALRLSGCIRPSQLASDGSSLLHGCVPLWIDSLRWKDQVRGLTREEREEREKP